MPTEPKTAAAKTPAKTASSSQFLNRYTSLPIALDVLAKRRITLLSPETWEDRNDAYYLERYRDERKLLTLLAICFSLGRETFHHWRIFSSGSSGVCIEFDKEKLLNSIPKGSSYQHRNVTYKWVRELEKKKPELETWPFLKRKPFKDEHEYRIIYESKTENLRAKPIPIDLSAIRKVTLSPWLPDPVSPSVINIIKKIDGCGTLEVSRSSLIDNAGWRKIVGQS
jgi:Protein of unknown function (DUF2971)